MRKLIDNIFFKPHPDCKTESTPTDQIRTDTRYFFLFQIFMQGLVAMTIPSPLFFFPIKKIGAVFLAILIGFILHAIRYLLVKRGHEKKSLHWKGMFFLQYTRIYNVWFYVLIIGMITNNCNKNYQEVNLITGLQDEHSFNYLTDMLKTFMISILAFLASNIINQMLGIKDGYDEMKKKGDQFLNDLKESEAIIKNMVSVNAIIAPINSLMSDVQSNGTLSLEKQVNLFTANISSYTKALTELNKYKELRVWSFSLFNKYIESNRIFLQEYRTVFIPFEELKSVVTKFMKFALLDENSKKLPLEKKHQFYALFASNPKAFFPEDRDSQKSAAYCKWNFHIKQDSNADGAIKKGINEMHRLFVSVDNHKFPDMGLSKNNVDKALNEDAHNKLIELIADAESHLLTMQEDSKQFHQTYIRDLKVIETKYSGKKMTIRDLLKEYHSENCVKILKLNASESSLITGKDNKYVKDYFAIKRCDENNNYVWSYCLAGEFHPDFKAIEINIYDERMSKNKRTGKTWEQVKDDLENIFNHKSIVEL